VTGNNVTFPNKPELAPWRQRQQRMSRLESAIRRLEAQRDCIDWAAEQLHGAPGHILELGLGNGRTYDHLRERFPGRDIYVFDRQIAAHPDCIPGPDFMFQGDVLEMLPVALACLGCQAIMVHSDIGTGDPERNRRLAVKIAPLLAPMMLTGGLVLSDQPMSWPDWTELELPSTVPAGRYHIYRA
jgi:hypothetical protein